MAVLNEMLKNLGSLTDEELEELVSRLEVEKSSREKFEDTKGLIVNNGKCKQNSSVITPPLLNFVNNSKIVVFAG